MDLFTKMLSIPKEKVYITGILFFLYILQHTYTQKLWCIDLMLLGLIFYVFFVERLWFSVTVISILVINLLTGYQFQFFGALSYYFIPLLAKELSRLLNLTFAKYFFLCLLLISVYTLIMLGALKVLGFKNVFIAATRNILAACLIYIAFRHTFYFRQPDS